MVKREELLIATARATGLSGAYIPTAMVPSGLKRYIYYFEAMVDPAAVGTTRARLQRIAATGAPVASADMHWFNFMTRGEQAWFPDELKEDSLPIAVIEASCRTMFRPNHTARAKILYTEGV